VTKLNTALEQHYTPVQIAARWGCSDDCIRDLFIDEPGVLKITRPETLHKRRYVSLRIPESVVVRVGARLAA
jgi:hypothetical protein